MEVLGADNGLRIWDGWVVGLLKVVSIDLDGKRMGTVLEAVGRRSSCVEPLGVAAVVVLQYYGSR